MTQFAPPQQYQQPMPQPQYGQPQGFPPAPYGQLQQPFAQPQPAQQFGQQPGYGWPQPQQTPPPQPLAQGSIDDFYAQPSTGGAFLKFNQPGDTYVGIVAHTPTKADVRQITTPPNQGSVPQFYRDGRPKLEMLVSLRMQPTQANPEGIGLFPVKGADRDELARAMSEAGAPEGPPEAGALMQIVHTHLQATRGGIPRKVKQIRYVRPDQVAGANAQPTEAPATQQAPQAMQPAGQQPVAQYAQPAQQFAPQQGFQQPQPQTQYAPQVQQPAQAPVAQQAPMQPDPAAAALQQAQQFAQQPQAPAQPIQQPPAAAQPQAPAGMTPEQQALLAKLQGAGA